MSRERSRCVEERSTVGWRPGTTFQQVLDEVRFEVARQLLGESSISLDDVAATLGYAGIGRPALAADPYPMQSSSSRLADEAQAMLEGLRSEDHELAIKQIVVGYRPGPAAGRRGHAANRCCVSDTAETDRTGCAGYCGRLRRRRATRDQRRSRPLRNMTGFDLQYEFPTIFMTAQTADRFRRRLIGSGAVTCLFKPFSEAALLKAGRGRALAAMRLARVPV
jgi:CheY-like chemotaxis protein